MKSSTSGFLDDLKHGFLILFTIFSHNGSASDPNCHWVRLEKTNILCFDRGIGSVSAETRSEIVSQKILNVAEDFNYDLDSISVTESEGSFIVAAKDLPLISLSNKDIPKGSSSSTKDFALEIATKVKGAVSEYRTKRTPEALTTGMVYAILTLIAFFLAISSVNKFFKFARVKLDQVADKYLDRLKIKSYRILSPYRVKQIIGAAISLVKVVVYLALVYTLVTLELGYFPWTTKYSTQIISLMSAPLKEVTDLIIGYLPNIFYIIVIIAITHYLLKFIRLFFDELERDNIQIGGFHREWANPTFKLIRFLFYALALVMMFPYLPGSSSPAFQGLSVFFGVLISFGSGSSIANIISGIVITYMRPFKVGDRVKIADTMGDITEKNFLVTRVKTIKNVDITIPNSMVLGSHIFNYSSSAETDGLILNTTVTIGYDVPWKKIHKLLEEAALRTDLIIKEKRPFVYQTALNDFYVSYELNAYTRHANKMAKIYSDLHLNIQDVFNAAGVEIMSPHYGALRDGNETTIPANYRGDGYVAPKFGISTDEARR